MTCKTFSKRRKMTKKTKNADRNRPEMTAPSCFAPDVFACSNCPERILISINLHVTFGPMFSSNPPPAPGFFTFWASRASLLLSAVRVHASCNGHSLKPTDWKTCFIWMKATNDYPKTELTARATCTLGPNICFALEGGYLIQVLEGEIWINGWPVASGEELSVCTSFAP
jgi:hypothetical protein